MVFFVMYTFSGQKTATKWQNGMGHLNFRKIKTTKPRFLAPTNFDAINKKCIFASDLCRRGHKKQAT
ncbi:MAG: hypothetical protein BHV77_15235 [Bacteroides sp. 43_108]|nr:MAG: hypothetical protein BHV77_15235 [Bacteroides sp. 43_108]